ncbi:hypothetical protein CHS0354_023867 [Potamilus streckersoni]|uniref:BIG2 domain-containing protein n=1 Tax=Potamilus streckersoni TaxID=2493646 RepID=A0AAE0RZ74_9BIVA|nr:hypothetical protein CHS0354_023867 [Potamilus streckersoni]
MSDQELKHIVASLAISIKEVSAQIKELSASQKKTDEQIKELFASQKKTDAQQKKTDAQQKKTDAQQKKTDEQIKELSASQKKTDEQIKELFASQKKTDEQIKELSVEHKKTESTLKGLGFNVGMAVEEYFYNSLDLTKKVANIQFDDCQKNLHGFNRELKLQDEFDITMANTTKGLLVECKHHVVKEDVVKLRERKVKNLKILYPDFKDLEMYLAVAGASFDSDAKQEAKQSGIIILKQVGDVMEEEKNTTPAGNDATPAGVATTYAGYDATYAGVATTYAGYDVTPAGVAITPAGVAITPYLERVIERTQRFFILSFFAGECASPEPTKYTVTLNENGGTAGSTTSITIENGKTVTLPTSGLPTKTGCTLTAWNTKVDGTGTAFVFGTTTVTANITIYAQWEEIRITSFTLGKTTDTTLLGKTTQLTATILPEDALKSVTWTSSDNVVATVSETGLITPVSAGTVNITATSTADNTKSATVAVTVRNYFYVPDANFASKLKYKDAVWITTIDGVNGLNIDAVSKFEGSLDIRSSNIASLQGIEYFTSLTTLNCYNNQLKTLDVSKNVNLADLRCSDNQLQTLDVSKNVNLTDLYCYNNQLKTLDVSKNVNLADLRCSDNQLQTLDVSKNVNLTDLYCYSNQLQTLDVSQNVNLTGLNCYSNQLQTLDVSQNVNLTGLNCSSNQLKTLDVSQNVKLTGLNCYNNQLKTLDVSQNVNLTGLNCYNNQMTTLKVSETVNLKSCYCNSNQLQTLDVSKNVELEALDCYNNQLTTLDVSQNVKLTGLNCYNNQLKTLDVSKNVNLTGLSCYNNQLTSLDMRGMRLVAYLYITTVGNNGGNSNSGLTSVKVHSSVVTHQELRNAKKATGLQIDTYTAASGSTTYTQAICDVDPNTGLRASTARACTP